MSTSYWTAVSLLPFCYPEVGWLSVNGGWAFHFRAGAFPSMIADVLALVDDGRYVQQKRLCCNA